MGFGKRAAAGGAIALLVVGGSGAAVSLITHGSRGAARAGQNVPTPPVTPLPGAGPVAAAGSGGALLLRTPAGRVLSARAVTDHDVKTVMCAAFSFFDQFGYDPRNAPSFADFTNRRGNAITATPRRKAVDVYQDVQQLDNRDATQLDSRYCDAAG